MPRTHERTFRVRHYECDAYDTVYYTNYLRYIQETAMDASAAAGFGPEWYASRGFVWLVRDTAAELLKAHENPELLAAVEKVKQHAIGKLEEAEKN